jgi:hypothetical protein
MKISLLVPSRERLNLKLNLICSILTTVKNIDNVELVFGIDKDDPTREIVYKIAAAIPFVRVVDIENNGQFIGINRIWNILAANTNSEIFGYIGDDMIFKTPNWDEKILTEFNNENCPSDKIKLVHCYDGHRDFDEICVNAFIHRKYYEVLGYFTREEFLINWSDQWMYQTFNAFGRVKWLPEIHIQHNHWIYGERKKDKTADRMLSDKKDIISDQLWHDLASERIKAVEILEKYLNINPDWSKVDRT